MPTHTRSSAQPHHERDIHDHIMDNQAQPAIRWPRPSAPSLAYVTLWAVGGLVSLVVPLLIVPVGTASTSAASAWTAYAFTVLGAVIMLVAASLLFRRTKEAGLFIVGSIPAVVMVIGGVIMVTVKLT